MGYLVIDHSAGQGIDGRQGLKQEYDTVSCNHCQALIALLTRPTETLVFSCVDTAVATQQAPWLSQRYQGKHTCRGCRQSICRACAQRMATAGARCLPFKALLEEALAQAQRQEAWDYHYAQTLRNH